jgi:hypothetical protein
MTDYEEMLAKKGGLGVLGGGKTQMRVGWGNHYFKSKISV